MLEVCIVGLGALGTMYGYVLQCSGKVNITAVCRSNYEVLKSRGVDIRSEKFGCIAAWKPSRVVQTVEEAADRNYDYVVCTTKVLPDIKTTSQILHGILDKTTTVVLIQNGIGVEGDLLQAAHAVTIISGCAWIDATAIDGGKVVKHGAMDRLVLGVHHPPNVTAEAKDVSRARLECFVETLCAGGGGAVATDHIVAQRWRKNLWNIGYSVTSTLSRTNITVLLSDHWVKVIAPVVRGLMEEEVAVARAIGIDSTLLPDSAVADTEDLTHKFHAETYTLPREKYTPVYFKPSMLVDFEAGRPMEVEGIIGAVVKKAKELGVSVPRLETAYASLALYQESFLQGYQNKTV